MARAREGMTRRPTLRLGLVAAGAALAAQLTGCTGGSNHNAAPQSTGAASTAESPTPTGLAPESSTGSCTATRIGYITLSGAERDAALHQDRLPDRIHELAARPFFDLRIVASAKASSTELGQDEQIIHEVAAAIHAPADVREERLTTDDLTRYQMAFITYGVAPGCPTPPPQYPSIPPSAIPSSI